MAETVTMPKLGFDMAEGTLVRWVKTAGEEISRGDVLAEIETDKATVEVESSYTGVLRKLLVNQGDVVPVGTPIAVVGEPGEEIPEDAGSAGEKEAAPAKTPGQGEAGAPVKEPAGESQTTPVGHDGAQAVEDEGMVRASPLAKRLARDNQMDLRDVSGSGPGGRVVRRDVEAALKAAVSAPRPPAAAKPVVNVPLPSVAPLAGVQDEVVPLNRLRSAIGRRMVESKQQVPHFYVTHEYDVKPLLQLRKQVNDLLPEGDKISVNDFLVKAVALGLRQFPNLNASITENEIVRHGHVNVGVAVAVEGGLLTVVSRDADVKPVRLISSEIKAMVDRARQGKVRPDDIEGSTFSISNLGMFDVEHFVAIINPPEAAILAVGSAKEIPVIENGEVKVGTRMRATISADHRVTDGAEAAKFMQVLEEFIEKPMRLLV
jgi:pyruvate dehydrogenase E2 component (dihydrolipoamide acetyltransferase)